MSLQEGNSDSDGRPKRCMKSFDHSIPLVAVLADRFGSRTSEDSSSKRKLLLKIGGIPIIWHIMKNFFAQDLEEFLLLFGYKAYMFSGLFAMRDSDVVFDSPAGITLAFGSLADSGGAWMRPAWSIATAIKIQVTDEWSRVWLHDGKIRRVTAGPIAPYLESGVGDV